MHRFYIPKSEMVKAPLTLAGTEWRHCQTVLRVQKGEKITVFDGEGTECLCQIQDANANHALLQVLQKNNTPPPPYSITLAQALPKNKTMDYIIQKATELGVRRIIPVTSDRSTVKLEVAESQSRIERWCEISIEGAKQCGLNWLPSILPLKTVREMVELQSKNSLSLIASLQPDAKPLWEYLGKGTDLKKEITIMIGPEGDFTPAEINLAKSSGFQPMTLGPLVLRSDTAAIYSISTLSYELRRLKQSAGSC